MDQKEKIQQEHQASSAIPRSATGGASFDQKGSFSASAAGSGRPNGPMVKGCDSNSISAQGMSSSFKSDEFDPVALYRDRKLTSAEGGLMSSCAGRFINFL